MSEPGHVIEIDGLLNMVGDVVLHRNLEMRVRRDEVMTLVGDVLGSEQRSELLMPFYFYILIWFFLYCYPIARWTVHLERKYAVNQ